MSDRPEGNEKRIMKEWMKRKRVLVVMVIIIIGLVILGVGLIRDAVTYKKQSKLQEKEVEEIVELKMVYAYQNPQWNAAMEQIIQSFEQENPGIHIQYELTYEDNVYEDILSRKIARNELGDIVQLKTPEAYAAAGLLGTIDESVNQLVTSDYQYDGKIYGVGMVESTWGILYNKDLFTQFGLEEPSDYEDFLFLCRVIKNKGITPIGIGGKDLWHMEFWTNHFFRSDVIAQDPDWLQKCQNGDVKWTDQQPRQMAEHLYDLFHSDFINENWRTTTDTSLAYKMSEWEVAMIYTGPWTASAIYKLNPELNLGWFYVPDESGVTYAADNHDTYWAVTAECQEDAQKYEAAMTFLSYFYNQDVYSDLCLQTSNFPLIVQQTTYEVTPIQEEMWVKFHEADQQIQIYIGNEDTPENFEREMLEILREMLENSCTIEEGLRQIQEVWVRCSRQGGGSR